jgi:hypothetical protein
MMQRQRAFLTFMVMAMAGLCLLLWRGAPVGMVAAEAGRHQLTLRLRYPDGRPVSGVAVSLARLPDREVVGWQFTDNACRTDERGECRWHVFGGLYEFVFAEDLQPDAVTLAAAGSHGLNGLGVYLDRDFTVGLVLADPGSRAAGQTLFFDRAPDAPQPSFFVPDVHHPHHHPDDREEDAGAVIAALPQATEAADAEAVATTEVAPEGEAGPSNRPFPWLFVATAVLMAGAGLTLFRRRPVHAGRPAATAVSRDATPAGEKEQ